MSQFYEFDEDQTSDIFWRYVAQPSARLEFGCENSSVVKRNLPDTHSRNRHQAEGSQ